MTSVLMEPYEAIVPIVEKQQRQAQGNMVLSAKRRPSMVGDELQGDHNFLAAEINQSLSFALFKAMNHARTLKRMAGDTDDDRTQEDRGTRKLPMVQTKKRIIDLADNYAERRQHYFKYRKGTQYPTQIRPSHEWYLISPALSRLLLRWQPMVGVQPPTSTTRLTYGRLLHAFFLWGRLSPSQNDHRRSSEEAQGASDWG